MSASYPWLRAAALAGSLVLSATSEVSAQRARDAGAPVEDEPADDGEEDGDDVVYVDEEPTAESGDVGPGSASISGGGLGCSLTERGAQDALAPLLLVGLLIARRRRR